MRSFEPADPPLDPEADHAFLLALARGLARDEAGADDLAQEAWLRVLTHPELHVRSPRAWMRQVVRRIAFTSFRTELARSERERQWTSARRAPAADEPFEQQRRRERIARALDGLRESQREVILLRYFDDLPPREIALRLGVNVETVRTRLKRGLLALRGRLATAEGRGRSWRPAIVAVLRALQPRTAWGPLACASAALVLVGCALFLAARGPKPRAEALELAARSPRLASDPAPAAAELARATQLAAAEATAVMTEGELEVAFVELDTGRGVGNVAFELSPLERPDAPKLEARTDSAGRARIALAPGAWRLDAERGRAARFSMRAGERTPLEIALPRSVTVRGRVLDARGFAIPDATAYVTRPLRTDAIVRSVRTDAAGRFVLEQVDPSSWIGASAAHHRDGTLQYLDDPAWASDETRDVELFLEPCTAPVFGRVQDREGRPISGAEVRPVLDLAGMFWRSPSDPLAEPSPIQETRASDADGRFALDDLMPYPWQLVVRAPGYADASLAIQPDASLIDGSAADVVLDAGRRIQGRVRYPDGRPASGARVSIRCGTQLGPYAVLADADGRFAIERLPRGELRGVASCTDRGASFSATALFELVRGDELAWDVELQPGGAVHGRFALDDGRPAGNVLVSLRAPHTQQEEWIPNEHPAPARWTVTDGEGRFAFGDCLPLPHLLDAWEGSAQGLVHLDSLEGVRPDPVPFVHTLRAERGSLTGAFLDAAAAERGGSTLWIDAPSWPTARRVAVDPHSGRYCVEDLCAGKYVLFAWLPGKAPRRVLKAELAVGEHRELAPVSIEVPGAVSIAFAERTLGAGRALLDVSLHERGSDGWGASRPVDHLRLGNHAGPWRFEDVPPGDYVLAVGGDGRALEWFPLLVESGRTSELALELAPCAIGPIDVVLPALESSQPRVSIELFDTNRRLRARLRRAVTEIDRASGLLQIPVELPRGRYTYRARLEGTQRVAKGTLEVERTGACTSLGVIEL